MACAEARVAARLRDITAYLAPLQPHPHHCSSAMSTQARRPRGRPVDDALRSRRENDILDMAARLFADRGYAGTDLQVVADALEVGKGTIYRYFRDKQSLFLAAVDRGMTNLRERVDHWAAQSDDLLHQLPLAIYGYLEFFDSNPHIVELLIQERAVFRDRPKPTYFQHRDADVVRWERQVAELIAEGRIRDIPVEAISEVVGDSLYGTMFTNYFAGRKRSVSEQCRNVVDILFHGILTPAELKRWHWEVPQATPGQRARASSRRKK